jgi:hypothetical protein
MAKRIKKIENIEVIDAEIVQPIQKTACITCGKDFSNDFKSVVERKKLEAEKFKINYYVFKNQKGDWSITANFDIKKTKDNEYFHISEFKPN